MRERMGVVQSTSSVVFLGMDTIGDWLAILGVVGKSRNSAVLDI